MGLTELIERFQSLSEAKQTEVLDFVEFLATRPSSELKSEKTLECSTLAQWMKHPLTIDEFTPLSRDEAHER